MLPVPACMLKKKSFDVREMGKRCSQCGSEAKSKPALLVESSMSLEDGAEALVDVAERLAWAGWSAVFVDLWLAVSVNCVVSVMRRVV